MTKAYLKGVGLLVGMIFGAGIFALPYTFAKAGVFWGLFHFALVFIILLFLHLLYGEVAYYAGAKHRLTGYVEMFLGRWPKEIAFLVVILSYYGSLLVYGLLAGLFLSNIFQGFSPSGWTVLFFVLAGFLLFSRKKDTSSINFYLTVPLLIFILYLLFLALPHIRMENFSLFNSQSDWFLPYGVWLFALSGFSVIPELREIFANFSVKNFRTTISWSFVISSFFFLVFIIAVYGAGGLKTSEDAISGLAAVLGEKALLVGSLIGFLSVFGAYLALSMDMKNIFKLDYKIPNLFSLFLAVVPPLILFFLGANNFVKTMSVTGVLGMGILAVFIISMSRKMRQKNTGGDFIPTNRGFENFILAAVVLGVLFELFRIFL